MERQQEKTPKRFVPALDSSARVCAAFRKEARSEIPSTALLDRSLIDSTRRATCVANRRLRRRKGFQDAGKRRKLSVTHSSAKSMHEQASNPPDARTRSKTQPVSVSKYVLTYLYVQVVLFGGDLLLYSFRQL